MIKILKSENGGITVFVIIAFLFIMIMLISMYMNNVNYQITTLQAEERLKEIYGRDVNNANVILANMFSYNIILNANGGTVETANIRSSRAQEEMSVVLITAIPCYFFC